MYQYTPFLEKNSQIAVIGLGYVGLPLALEFAKKHKVIGFDISQERVALMQKGIDPSCELESSAFEDKDIVFTANLDDIHPANFYIVTVPTPVNEYKIPEQKLGHFVFAGCLG